MAEITNEEFKHMIKQGHKFIAKPVMAGLRINKISGKYIVKQLT
jgi:hypothetical protein